MVRVSVGGGSEKKLRPVGGGGGNRDEVKGERALYLAVVGRRNCVVD